MVFIAGMRVFCLVLVLVGGSLGCGESRVPADAVSRASVFDGPDFLNIAHRGGARLAPEHTLVAYQNGLAVGADVIELDLHATADGVVVAMHDETVDRTTNGSGAIKHLPFAELRQLDAGYRFTRDGGQTYPWRGKGLTVPTLDEALDLLRDTPLSVEFKQRTPSIVASVVASFDAHGGIGDVVFVSFPQEPTDQLRSLRPSARSAFTATELGRFLILGADVDGYQPPAGFIQPPQEGVDALFLARAHRLGLKVHPWTVNERDEMCRLKRLGADGIFTDDPASLDAVKHDPACARG